MQHRSGERDSYVQGTAQLAATSSTLIDKGRARGVLVAKQSSHRQSDGSARAGFTTDDQQQHCSARAVPACSNRAIRRVIREQPQREQPDLVRHVAIPPDKSAGWIIDNNVWRKQPQQSI